MSGVVATLAPTPIPELKRTKITTAPACFLYIDWYSVYFNFYCRDVFVSPNVLLCMIICGRVIVAWSTPTALLMLGWTGPPCAFCILNLFMLLLFYCLELTDFLLLWIDSVFTILYRVWFSTYFNHRDVAWSPRLTFMFFVVLIVFNEYWFIAMLFPPMFGGGLLGLPSTWLTLTCYTIIVPCRICSVECASSAVSAERIRCCKWGVAHGSPE